MFCSHIFHQLQQDTAKFLKVLVVVCLQGQNRTRRPRSHPQFTLVEDDDSLPGKLAVNLVLNLAKIVPQDEEVTPNSPLLKMINLLGDYYRIWGTRRERNPWNGGGKVRRSCFFGKKGPRFVCFFCVSPWKQVKLRNKSSASSMSSSE